MSPIFQTGGVNDVYSYHELVLDSSARDAGTNEHPIFQLAEPLQNVMGVQLLEARFPIHPQLLNIFNNNISLGINGNDMSPPKPTFINRRLHPGYYSSLLDLAQAIADCWDPILQDHFPDRYRMSVRLNSEGKVEWYLTDRSTGAFAPPDPDGVNSISLHIEPNYEPGLSPWDLRDLLGTPKPGNFYFLPNIITAPELPNFILPSNIALRCSPFHRVSRRLLHNGSTAQTPPFVIRHALGKGERYLDWKAQQRGFCFSTELDIIQNVALDLVYDDPFWSQWSVDLQGHPWTVRIAVLTQKQYKIK